MANRTMTPTRTEVAQVVDRALSVRAATRADLLATAVRVHARPEVVELLKSLPDRRFRDRTQVWAALPDLPHDQA